MDKKIMKFLNRLAITVTALALVANIVNWKSFSYFAVPALTIGLLVLLRSWRRFG